MSPGAWTQVTCICDRNHTAFERARKRGRNRTVLSHVQRHVTTDCAMCGPSHGRVRQGTSAGERANLHFARKPANDMSSRFNRSTSQRLRASFLALAAITVLAAGVLPTCADGICCPLADAPTVHTQMPCCVDPSIAPRDAVRLQPATSAGSTLSPPTWASGAVVEQPGATQVSPPRVQATLATVSLAHHEPSPPLFLLNAQFLI
jgi:hypothetical protein